MKKDRKLFFDEHGNFASPNPEKLSKKVIGVRLPISVEPKVKQLAGDDLSNWIRQAIVEKLERES